MGSGSAFASIFPIEVSGSLSNDFQAAGMQYVGNRRAAWPRSSASSIVAPSAGTT